MISYQDIRDVHLEISSLCNAACPWCPRTFWGYPYNGGYPETNLTLDQARNIFSEDFLSQLKTIRINGNFGDIVMNPHGPDIVDYFLGSNPDLKISINTNGSARDRSFWQRLSDPRVKVLFALDGLEDTHHLYRQNTVWSQVIKNAQTVIESGGHAIWQMIRFKHNQHQIDQCRELSEKLGFQEFCLIDSVRDSAPVFDNKGNLSHIIGDYQGETDFQILFYKKQHDDVLLEDIVPGKKPCQNLDCETKRLKSIYVSANGDVYPCCFTGLYPRTYGRGQYHQAANRQIADLAKNNNALERPLAECIQWFDRVEQSWEIASYEKGRLVICDDACGH